MSVFFPYYSTYPATNEPIFTTLFQSMEHIGPGLEDGTREGAEGWVWGRL